MYARHWKVRLCFMSFPGRDVHGFSRTKHRIVHQKKAPAPWQTQGFYYVIGDGMHNKASSVLVELGIPLFGMIYVIISYKVGPPR